MAEVCLPTVSEILALGNVERGGRARAVPAPVATDPLLRAQQQWVGAIAALEILLERESQGSAGDDRPSDPFGLVLSGPVPAIGNANLLSRLAVWSFAAPSQAAAKYLPAGEKPAFSAAIANISLAGNDLLAKEQFCLLLASRFSLAMALGRSDRGRPVFLYSFEPNIVRQCLEALRLRLEIAESPWLGRLDRDRAAFPPAPPTYQTVMEFGQLLLQCLPDLPAARSHPRPQRYSARLSIKSNFNANLGFEPHKPTVVPPPKSDRAAGKSDGKPDSKEVPEDVALLQAFVHEVYTPLATIRTLTRLLLKRKNLEPEVLKRLQTIDRECTEQIERMDLIFRAVELETSAGSRSPLHLTPTSLDRIFKDVIPRWQKQLLRRSLTLDAAVPQALPPVTSDPNLLDRVLTGLFENFTSDLPTGSHVRVRVELAGDRLKLQMHSDRIPASASMPPALRALGQLLVFQPETGNLSLNLAVSKNLVRALGGKLTVRQRSRQGRVLTIFLPLDMGKLLG